MVARGRHHAFAVVAGLLLVAAACETTPLLAPTGSTITLTTPSSTLSPTGSTSVVAQVLEAAGTPPHSGTHVLFTATLGRVVPSDAVTDSSGRAIGIFTPGGANGMATITAASGGATTSPTGALKIAVGTAAVGAVRVGANPASVSALGGSTTITANVLDINGNVLPEVPVNFITTAGAITAGVVITDANGAAQTVLTTTQQATVTASVGAQGTTGTGTTGTGTTGTGTTGTTTTPTTTGQSSASVTITVNAAPTLVITPPTTPPSAGLASSYTFVVTLPATNGSAVRSLRVNWGDGITQELGSVTGSAVVQHTYHETGSYTITATLTDASGNVQTVSSSVSVIPVATPTVIITPSVPSSCTGAGACTVTFLLQVTPPTGVGIVSVNVTFGPSASPPQQGLGGLTGSATLSARYPAGAGTQTVTVTVLDTLGRTTQGFTTITIP